MLMTHCTWGISQLSIWKQSRMATTWSDQIWRCQQTTRKQSRSNGLRKHQGTPPWRRKNWWKTQAKGHAFQNEKNSMTGVQSSGVSGGSLHGGASSKVEKAHLAAWKRGPENCRNEIHCAPLCAGPWSTLWYKCAWKQTVKHQTLMHIAKPNKTCNCDTQDHAGKLRYTRSCHRFR